MSHSSCSAELIQLKYVVATGAALPHYSSFLFEACHRAVLSASPHLATMCNQLWLMACEWRRHTLHPVTKAKSSSTLCSLGCGTGTVPDSNATQSWGLTNPRWSQSTHKKETFCCFKWLRFGSYLLLQHNLVCPDFYVLMAVTGNPICQNSNNPKPDYLSSQIGHLSLLCPKILKDPNAKTWVFISWNNADKQSPRQW